MQTVLIQIDRLLTMLWETLAGCDVISDLRLLPCEVICWLSVSIVMEVNVGEECRYVDWRVCQRFAVNAIGLYCELPVIRSNSSWASRYRGASASARRTCSLAC